MDMAFVLKDNKIDSYFAGYGKHDNGERTSRWINRIDMAKRFETKLGVDRVNKKLGNYYQVLEV